MQLSVVGAWVAYHLFQTLPVDYPFPPKFTCVEPAGDNTMVTVKASSSSGEPATRARAAPRSPPSPLDTAPPFTPGLGSPETPPEVRRPFSPSGPASAGPE
eukprot:13720327-Alexandrium_andersonii.AAC.1